MELDSATGGKFFSQQVWKKLGKNTSICQHAFTDRFRNVCCTNLSGSEGKQINNSS